MKQGGEAGGAGITGCRNGSVVRERGGRQELGDAERGEWRRRSSQRAVCCRKTQVVLSSRPRGRHAASDGSHPAVASE